MQAIAGDTGIVVRNIENRFKIEVPNGWGAVETSSELVWDVASNNGTSLPECNIKVTKNPAFSIISNGEYIKTQSVTRMKRILSMYYHNVSFGVWETDWSFGNQRALHYVYTGTRNGNIFGSIGIQTVRFGRLYTFTCNALGSQLPNVYTNLIDIANTFEFL